jgi:hypothetical protein
VLITEPLLRPLLIRSSLGIAYLAVKDAEDMFRRREEYGEGHPFHDTFENKYGLQRPAK